MDDVDLEQRLDRFNGVFTATMCAIYPCSPRATKQPRKPSERRCNKSSRAMTKALRRRRPS